MSTSGIGSTPSFWQQDQSYWSQQQSASSSQAATNSVIDAMGSAEASLGKGLASIANKTALSRVNSQLSQAIQNSAGRHDFVAVFDVKLSFNSFQINRPRGRNRGWNGAAYNKHVPINSGNSCGRFDYCQRRRQYNDLCIDRQRHSRRSVAGA